jgi:hypothetical protein
LISVEKLLKNDDWTLNRSPMLPVCVPSVAWVGEAESPSPAQIKGSGYSRLVRYGQCAFLLLDTYEKTLVYGLADERPSDRPGVFVAEDVPVIGTIGARHLARFLEQKSSTRLPDILARLISSSSFFIARQNQADSKRLA